MLIVMKSGAGEQEIADVVKVIEQLGYRPHVMPGATRTDFWELAGSDIDSLPQEIVMTADDLVDFDENEFVEALFG